MQNIKYALVNNNKNISNTNVGYQQNASLSVKQTDPNGFKNCC